MAIRQNPLNVLHALTHGDVVTPVDLTVIRAGRLLTVSILRGSAPVPGVVDASSKRTGVLRDERVQQVMGINSSLDAIQARLSEGYELPPVHDNFWEHAHIVRKFSVRARELLDEVDCAIGHCKAQQKALNEVSRMTSGVRDAAADKQHVFDCAQASCRISELGLVLSVEGLGFRVRQHEIVHLKTHTPKS